MNKVSKKVLLNLVMGLGIVATTIPAITYTTSCATQEEKTQPNLEIGKYVWVAHQGYQYEGILIDVKQNYLYIDTYIYDGVSNHIYPNLKAIPINCEAIWVSDDDELSLEYAIALLNDFRYQLSEKNNYTKIDQHLTDYVQRIRHSEGKRYGQELLSNFRAYMTYYTVEKMDEIINELKTKRSFTKWNEWLNYYSQTFVWYRASMLQGFDLISQYYGVSLTSEERNSLLDCLYTIYAIVSIGKFKLIG